MYIFQDQAFIFGAVFLHVIVAGLLAILIDKLFPKYHPEATTLRQILEIALQISLGAVLVTRLHSLSSWFVPAILVTAIPFGVVESVMMITPQPELHAKVDHVQNKVRSWFGLVKSPLTTS